MKIQICAGGAHSEAGAGECQFYGNKPLVNINLESIDAWPMFKEII